MGTSAVGQAAEAAVAEYLTSQGFEILGKNWKTKTCEIDVIAQKDQIIYFVEVKYRISANQGSGFEHITPQKLKQLKFAARLWCSHFDWDGDYRISGAEVSGPNFDDIHLVEVD